jgi:two-component system KDP operon response regulator KdpE
MEELLARIRAATRRASGADAATTVTVGEVTVDLAAKIATGPDGQRIHLTPTEWHLLEQLLRRPGKLVTRRVLLTELRGAPEHTDPSYLRIYMAQLRRKLEPEPNRPRYLITEPGMGYRFQP